MARPKRNEANAYDCIVTAFWDMLAEIPYSKVTISGLARRAGVNHNLIYYYFENMDDLAAKLFHDNMSSGEPQLLLRQLLSGQANANRLIADEKKALVIGRLRLFMRSDSAYLNQIAKDAILTEWLESVEKKQEQLTDDERIDLQFIIGGLISIIGDLGNDLANIASMTERPLGEGARETLKRL